VDHLSDMLVHYNQVYHRSVDLYRFFCFSVQIAEVNLYVCLA
jgi:hypothetical protein